ncbi:MAG TPA: alanine--tRNA ligase-related protein, partial [Nitrospiria bacterium]|nr:alanine--tRNA ligase-related protein [Nitrospiria bacterium]
MTERLYQQDAYLKTFTAEVTDIREEGVVLSRTAFFPSGGGVLGDEGFLETGSGQILRVVETLDLEGEVVHRVDPGAAGGLSVGSA